MWTNSLRDPFILQGKTAKFYLSLSQDLVDRLIDFSLDPNTQDEWGEPTGCVIFDNATVKQKVYLINFCLNALLNPQVEAPTPTHILEAAAYFPFAYLAGQIEREIEREIGLRIDPNLDDEYEAEYFEEYFYITFYRRKTYKFYKETILSFSIADDIVPSFVHNECETFEDWQQYYQEILAFDFESTDMAKWRNIISIMAHDSVLGDDEDFTITSYRPQVMDGMTPLEENLGISEDYFSNRLPQVSDDEYEQALDQLYNYSISEDQNIL